MGYAALWVKSNLSFLVGASHPEELLERAHELGLSALALTDRHGVYGSVRAHTRAAELGIKLLHGAEVEISKPPLPDAFGPINEGLDQTDGRATALILAIDRTGWSALCQLLSRAHLDHPRARPELSIAALKAIADMPVIVLSDAPWLLGSLAEDLGDRLYGLCARHHQSDERRRENELRSRAKALRVPLVAAVEVLYHERSRRPLQDVLTCIRHGRTLHNAAGCTRPNAEHELKSTAEMAALFADAPEMIERTNEIAERCNFT
ncbi:MAG TPA: PHP domain-containing protein, partial [Nannocystis exedens]|nr:PHP domain-containing protein [Nannocystis exedens]